jgi:hypothetical protein
LVLALPVNLCKISLLMPLPGTDNPLTIFENKLPFSFKSFLLGPTFLDSFFCCEL